VATELSAENRRQVWVPPGFAHGFAALSDSAECLYKTTDYWSPENERTLLWNDPALAIDWPVAGEPIVSSKDQRGTPLAQAEAYP
jgi:dTDP-4-dehydrorhamnose 3,5-epimerase